MERERERRRGGGGEKQTDTETILMLMGLLRKSCSLSRGGGIETLPNTSLHIHTYLGHLKGCKLMLLMYITQGQYLVWQTLSKVSSMPPLLCTMATRPAGMTPFPGW